MSWFRKEKRERTTQRQRLEIPADAWDKCPQCGHIDLREKFDRALQVCVQCGHHRRIPARRYLEVLTDPGSFVEQVGRQHFRIFKFDPTRSAADLPPREKSSTPAPAGAPAREKAPGEALPTFDLDVTATVIVAGALATRDFMPVHHDRDFAQAQGAPDLFMNILSSNAYVSRYLTDWPGPEARVASIKVRLGVPVVPGQVLGFSGSITKLEPGADESLVEIALRASNELGDHVTGSATLTLPPG